MAGWGTEKSELIQGIVSDLIKRVRGTFGATSVVGREAEERLAEALADQEVLRSILGSIATRNGAY